MEKISFDEFKSRYNTQIAQDKVDAINTTFGINVDITEQVESILKADYDSYLAGKITI